MPNGKVCLIARVYGIQVYIYDLEHLLCYYENPILCFVGTQDYTNKRLHAVRIRVLPRGSVQFEVRGGRELMDIFASCHVTGVVLLQSFSSLPSPLLVCV